MVCLQKELAWNRLVDKGEKLARERRSGFQMALLQKPRRQSSLNGLEIVAASYSRRRPPAAVIHVYRSPGIPYFRGYAVGYWGHRPETTLLKN